MRSDELEPVQAAGSTPSHAEEPVRGAPRPRNVLLLVWGGIALMQTYRAARACQEFTTATQVYFALLTTALAAALWLALDGWFLPDARQRERDTAGPVVVLCIGLMLAMRLIEVCAGVQ